MLKPPAKTTGPTVSVDAVAVRPYIVNQLAFRVIVALSGRRLLLFAMPLWLFNCNSAPVTAMAEVFTNAALSRKIKTF